MLEHKPSGSQLVVGNTHLDYHPSRDFVKYTQANFVRSKLAEFMRRECGTLVPVIMCGDFNSLPVSSVVSAFHGEDIESKESSWTIPKELKKEGASQVKDFARGANKAAAALTGADKVAFYKKGNKLQKQEDFEPIGKRLQSAYAFYKKAPKLKPSEMHLKLNHTMPPFTNYTLKFQGTLDHIFFAEAKLKLLELLTIPEESQLRKYGAIPSLEYPSDHFRLEAKFLIL